MNSVSVIEKKVVGEQMKTDGRFEKEYEGNGFVLLGVPFVLIFLAFAVLAKLGFEAGEVWAFLKIFILPATWDYQLNYEFTQFEKLTATLITILVLIFIAWTMFTMIEAVKSKLGHIKFFSVVLACSYKVIMFLFSLNFMFLLIRIIYHSIAAFLVWLW